MQCVPCPACRGRGFVGNGEKYAAFCWTCAGTGWISREAARRYHHRMPIQRYDAPSFEPRAARGIVKGGEDE
jgi:hypothetical protein